MTPERLMSIAQARGISIDALPSGARPEFTVAEVGQALAGLPLRDREQCYDAYAYRWGRDESRQHALYSYLSNEVYLGYSDHPPFCLKVLETYHHELMYEHDWQRKYLVLCDRERWPKLVREQKYIELLIRLALFEEHNWYVIRMHSLWATLLASSGFRDIDDDLWDKRLSRKYEGIREILDGWNYTAHRNAAMKLQGHLVAASS